jgi:hypothetical protein
MNEVTPEDKKLAELRSRHDTLWKLERSLNRIINNPKVVKRDEQKYISRIVDIKNERHIILKEIQKILDRKIEHKRHIESGEEDTLYDIEQKIDRLEKQKQRFITDLKNMENSKQVFDRQTHIDNINNIYKEQEVLMELHNKLERKEKKLLNKKEEVFPEYFEDVGEEDEEVDEEDDISPLDRAGIVWGEREKKAKHLKDAKIMNDLRQKTLNDLGLNLKKKSFSIGLGLGKEKSIPLDNSIGLGLGRKKIDMDSVEERIARLRNRYKDVKKMKQTLVGLINNPNTSGRDFYIAELKSLIDGKELEELEDEIRLL